MRRKILAGAVLALTAAAPATTQAATPFTAGGNATQSPRMAVTASGTIHIAWASDDNGKVGYCRILVSGLRFCAELPMPAGAAPAPIDVDIRTYGSSAVEIFAACRQCGDADTARIFQFSDGAGDSSVIAFGSALAPISGVPFGMTGPGTLVDTSVYVGVDGGNVLGMPDPGGPAVDVSDFPALAWTQVERVPQMPNLVSTSSSGGDIRTSLFDGATPLAANVNDLTRWATKRHQPLPSPIADAGPGKLFAGDETRATSRLGMVHSKTTFGDNRLFLRLWDTGLKEFSGPVEIQGGDPIDDSIVEYNAYQDDSGRTHVVWESDLAGGRLRYQRSETDGQTFSTAPVTIARGEAFARLSVAAGPDGSAGYAVWRVGQDIRGVALEQLVEPPPGGETPPGGTTPPPGTGTPPPGGGTTPPTTTPPRPDPLRVGFPGARYPGPVRNQTVTDRQASYQLGVPRGCVRPGQRFRVTLKWKRSKRKGNLFVKVRRTDFFQGTKRVKRDLKPTFVHTYRVTTTAKAGSSIKLRARAFIKVRRGKSPTKSVRATIKVCS